MRWSEREIGTIYFGGGTPSLIAAELIQSILTELINAGFHWGPATEITIEIESSDDGPSQTGFVFVYGNQPLQRRSTDV